MLDQSQIQAILDNEVIPIFEKLRMGRAGKDVPIEKWGDLSFTDTYGLYVGMLDEISVHSIRGVFPEKIVLEKSPYQTPEEFEHVKRNYEPVTQEVFDDFVNTVQRSFADSGWSIDYPEYPDKDENLQTYLDKGIENTPLAMPLEAWIKNVVPPIKLRDAGGCITVRPFQIPLTEQDGTLVVGSERYQPIPYYFDSRRLVNYKEMEYYMFLSSEKSVVTYSDKPVKEGLVFEVYDENTVWRAVQVGKKIDFIFEITPYYTHNRGAIPVTRLKGNPFYYDQELAYQSPFMPAVSVLNECIKDNNNLRAIKDKCVYPIRVMIGDTCKYGITAGEDHVPIICDGGYINDPVRGRYRCPQCGGTGRQNRLGPSGEILVDPQSFTNESELSNAAKAMYYVEPTTGTPEFLRREVDGYLNQARNVLKIKTTNSETVKPAAGTTATENQLDQKAMHAAIRVPRAQIFDLYAWVIDWIAFIGWGEDYETPTLRVSDSFDLKTEKDYIDEIARAVEAGVPQLVIQQLIMKYLSSLNYTESQAGKLSDLVIKADRLLTMPSEEIAMRVSSGLVAKWEALLHDSGPALAQELLRTDPALLTKDIAEQIKALQDLAKTKASEIEATRSTGQPSTLEDLRTRILGGTSAPTT